MLISLGRLSSLYLAKRVSLDSARSKLPSSLEDGDGEGKVKWILVKLTEGKLKLFVFFLSLMLIVFENNLQFFHIPVFGK